MQLEAYTAPDRSGNTARVWLNEPPEQEHGLCVGQRCARHGFFRPESLSRGSIVTAAKDSRRLRARPRPRRRPSYWRQRREPGGGLPPKAKDQPHALAYAQGAAMPSTDAARE